MIELVTLAPWLLLGAWLLTLRRRPRLEEYAPRIEAPDAPLVSVVLPARDEAERIGHALAALLATGYPAFEVVVVDDRSRDGTGDVARAFAERGGPVRVVDGGPLPAGWRSRAWACWQGYLAARGELLLFTAADARPASELVGRLVAALRREGAELAGAIPHRPAETFWQRVLHPQGWLAVRLRFPSAARVGRAGGPWEPFGVDRCLLATRAAYEAAGGHEAVRGAPAPGPALARRVREGGGRTLLVHGEAYLSVWEEGSLPGALASWSLRLAAAVRPAVWPAAAGWAALWLLPPAALAAAVFGAGGAGLLAWAAAAVGVSVAFWAAVLPRLRIPLAYALLYPVGAAGAIVAALAGRRRARVGAPAGPAASGPRGRRGERAIAPDDAGGNI